MSDIDVSLLNRVVQTYFMFNQEFAMEALPVLNAAATDGNVDSLSDAEQAALLDSIRESTTAAREQFNILTANRDSLVGTLRAAQRRLREAGATDETVNILAEVAGEDGEADELSAMEVEQLMAFVDQQLSELPEPELASIREQIRDLLSRIETIREENPLALVPTSRSAQRETIDLNFMKNIPESAFFGDSEQAQMLQQLLLLGRILHADEATGEPTWESREANWDLTWEDLESSYNNIPEERRAEMPPMEVMMANMRYLAHELEEGLNARLAELASAGEGGEEGGIAMQELLDHAAQFAGDPFFELLVGMAGDDGVLTSIDIERRTRELSESEGVEIDPQAFMIAARQWVLERRAALASSTAAAAPEAVLPRSQYTSIMALAALDGMSAGFTRMDREHVEDSAATWICNSATWILTLGGLLTAWVDSEHWHEGDFALGPTFRHYARSEVEENVTAREEALQMLREHLTHPPEEFLQYLEEHADRLDDQNGNHEPNIPNFLHYLLHEDDSEHPGRNRRIHEILTGSTIQIERIWGIYQAQENGEREEAEEMWVQLAEDLRWGVWSSDTYLWGISNPFFAQSIYSYMISKSGDEAEHPEWRRALDDSMGVTIFDDACIEELNDSELDPLSEEYADQLDACVLEEPRGESLWWPGNWFDWGGFLDGHFALNWSDQQEAEVFGDIASLLIGWRVGGWAFRILEPAAAVFGTVGSRAATAAAESGVVQRIFASMGVNLTEEMAMGGGRGILQRMFGPSATRWLASAEAQLAQATTATERQAAEAALRNAQRWHAMVNAEGAAGVAEAAAPRLSGWMGRVVRAHPPVPAFLEVAGEAGRRGLGAGLARGAAAFIQNISLSGLGRGLRYVGYDGILMLALVRQVYDNLRGERPASLSFDRELELGLPMAPLEEEDRGDAATDEPRDDDEADVDAGARERRSRDTEEEEE